MIHYHGTPIGGAKEQAAKFLIGKHALVSHAYPSQIAIVAECCQSFVLDNGAFTQWKKGRKVDVEGYVSWVKKWKNHPGFDWALVPDEIDGDEETNDALICDWNNAFPKNANLGVPVWHLHESLARLESLIESHHTVALGSSGGWRSPGSKPWWARITEAMAVACRADGSPLARLHGLRMLNPEVFQYLPLSSADSTNAGVNQGSRKRFGQYFPPTASLRATVIAERVERINSAEKWTGPPVPVNASWTY